MNKNISTQTSHTNLCCLYQSQGRGGKVYARSGVGVELEVIVELEFIMARKAQSIYYSCGRLYVAMLHQDKKAISSSAEIAISGSRKRCRRRERERPRSFKGHC